MAEMTEHQVERYVSALENIAGALTKTANALADQANAQEKVAERLALLSGYERILGSYFKHRSV